MVPDVYIYIYTSLRYEKEILRDLNCSVEELRLFVAPRNTIAARNNSRAVALESGFAWSRGSLEM
jgi:hypothetical protein